MALIDIEEILLGPVSIPNFKTLRKGPPFSGSFGLGRIKVVLSSIFLKKKRLVTFHLIFSSYLPSNFSAKISDSS